MSGLDYIGATDRAAEDAYGKYLASLKCDCGETATHRQNGRRVCNAHLDRDVDIPAFAVND